MFPTTYPYRGAGNSADISRNRAALAQHLAALDGRIQRLPQLFDSDTTTLAAPVLGSTLVVQLLGGQLVSDARVVSVADLLVTLPDNSECFLDIVPVGTGLPGDWPAGTILFQGSGTYGGSYQVIPGSATAFSPLDLSSGEPLVQSYTGQVTNPNGGWGPALLDRTGKGYVVRAAAGAGGIFPAVNGVSSGAALAILANNSANTGGQHGFTLKAQYLGESNGQFSYELTAMIDGTVLATATDTNGPDPASLFPGFVADGCTVYLSSWSWYNERGTPARGWLLTSCHPTEPAPNLVADGKRLFQISTVKGAPASVQVLFSKQTVHNRMASLRDSITTLTEAYI